MSVSPRLRRSGQLPRGKPAPDDAREILPGAAYPLGATVNGEGVNFSVFSKNAASMELLFFEPDDLSTPSRVIGLDPIVNRTFYYWHVFVPGVRSGQLYGYRAGGPFDPDNGLWFDGRTVLLDPYSRVVADETVVPDRETAPSRPISGVLRSVVCDPGDYDWEQDRPLTAAEDLVIYELHVGGFTKRPNSGVSASRRGKFAGLIDRIPYLVDLGVNAVELLPVQQFHDGPRDLALPNYWGYDPVAFFAPHRGYSSLRDPLGPAHEFKDMVKAFHRAGIRVILDVVFNHTGEGNEFGPTWSLRGLENRAYYIPADGRRGYANYSGCGNTVNGNHSIVRRLIVDCLKHWVQEMHVDGFRFDLASVLARDESGRPLQNPPVLWEIESDPVLSGSLLIAEAWDAAGLYQVGRFVGHRWAEWNGQFRDDVRRFVRGDDNAVGKLSRRIAASPDLYPDVDRDPRRSINFVVCHDGFTLRDLVSYNQKHNYANGEENRDGCNDNFSWNCGVEGPTDDPAVRALRMRQMKNLMTILLLSQGTPMFAAGDEIGRTQQGNNNAYCQDNEISWFDWDFTAEGRELRRFVRGLIRLRRNHPAFSARKNWLSSGGGSAWKLRWHGIEPFRPDWSHTSHSLAYEVVDGDAGEGLYVALNAYWEPLRFTLPVPPAKRVWAIALNTAKGSPDDVVEAEHRAPFSDRTILLDARSAAAFVAIDAEGKPTF